MRSRILVVEDETEIRELIALHIHREGQVVDEAATGEQALTLLFEKKYDLAIVDWMLPGTSGLELTKIIRQRPELMTMSVLMVTARAEPADIVAGLESGADDYLSKPFDPAVLMARVRALLRRSYMVREEKSSGAIELGDLKIDSESYETTCMGTKIELTRSEFKLLIALAQNRGRVLTRTALIDAIQGEGVAVIGRTVDTHVFGLRKKLGECADLIETVRGIGYRIR